MVKQDREKKTISRDGSSAQQFKRERKCEGIGRSQVKCSRFSHTNTRGTLSTALLVIEYATNGDS